MNHLKGWKILRKDQARRLKYQEKQRIQQKMVNAPGKNCTYVRDELTAGQLKSFSAKLVR